MNKTAPNQQRAAKRSRFLKTSVVCPVCEQRTWNLDLCHNCNRALDREATPRVRSRAQVARVSQANSRRKGISLAAENVWYEWRGREKICHFMCHGVAFEAVVQARFDTAVLVSDIVAKDGEFWFSVVRNRKLLRIDRSQETSIWKYFASAGTFD